MSQIVEFPHFVEFYENRTVERNYLNKIEVLICNTLNDLISLIEVLVIK